MSQIQLVSPGSAEEPSQHLPHVLLVVDGFPKALGGGERVVLRLARSLPHYGYRASILTFAIHPEGEFQPADAPCPLYLLPLTNTYDFKAVRGAFALRRLLRQKDVRVVQTFFESSDIWAGAVTRILSSAKLIWSRRDLGILRTAKHRYAYRAMHRFPHAVVAVSARVAEHVVAEDGVPAERVLVVHNGLDLEKALDRSASTQVENRPPLITTIGNVRRVKGHDLLVEAAHRLSARFPDAHFTIAGEILEPEYYAQLKARIQNLGLTNRFTFLGKITNLQAHLSTATLFVLPSRSEGFSNALIEAMAAGLPVIATDVGGNAEAVQTGRSGLIIPPEDPAALASAIATLLEDPGLAEQLSTGARRAVEENFTSDAMMRGFTDVFATVLARPLPE